VQAGRVDERERSLVGTVGGVSHHVKSSLSRDMTREPLHL
jgi:hypothetical protein